VSVRTPVGATPGTLDAKAADIIQRATWDAVSQYAQPRKD
jgi:hypothetical protein